MISPTDSGVEGPKLLNNPNPEYPSRAKSRRLRGAVKVRVLVDENGKVVKVTVAEGSSYFRKVSEEAAWKAKFKPATKDGGRGKMW